MPALRDLNERTTCFNLTRSTQFSPSFMPKRKIQIGWPTQLKLASTVAECSSSRTVQKQTVQIGNYLVGDDQPAFIIGEIGINHNGNVDITRNLISVAKNAGCNAVKFQKRTVEIVYTAEELAKPRENPFGETNGDLKRGLEFGLEQYKEIDEYCREVDILWFASAWDEAIGRFHRPIPRPLFQDSVRFADGRQPDQVTPANRVSRSSSPPG